MDIINSVAVHKIEIETNVYVKEFNEGVKIPCFMYKWLEYRNDTIVN